MRVVLTYITHETRTIVAVAVP